MNLRAFASAVVCVLGLVAPSNAESKQFAYPEMIGGTLSVEIPDDWSGSLKGPSIPEIASARFQSDSATEPLVLITLIAAEPGSPFANASPQSIKEIVSKSASRAAMTSVEGMLKVESFTSESMFGSYFSATDRAPPEGEFKYMSEGVASFGDFAVTFTALSHTAPVESRDIMLKIVRSLDKSGN